MCHRRNGRSRTGSDDPRSSRSQPVDPTPALEVCGVSYSYGAGFALEDVSLVVPPGVFTALLGQNGAGKTTLFSLITHLFESRDGAIRIVSGLMLMLGAIGLFLSSAIRQLENFAGIMNFVIFPMFFLSSALYPISQIGESSALLAVICRINPFTCAVELVRFSLYLWLNVEALACTAAGLFVFLTLAIGGYSPAKSLMPRKRGGAGGE